MFNYFRTVLSMKLGNKEGQGMIEYVLLVALIAIVVIAGLTYLGPIIRDRFNSVGDTLSNT